MLHFPPLSDVQRIMKMNLFNAVNVCVISIVTRTLFKTPFVVASQCKLQEKYNYTSVGVSLMINLSISSCTHRKWQVSRYGAAFKAAGVAPLVQLEPEV